MENFISSVIFIGFIFWLVNYIRARKNNNKLSNIAKYIGWITLLFFIILMLIQSPNNTSSSSSNKNSSESSTEKSENKKSSSKSTSSAQKSTKKLTDDPKKLKGFAKYFGRESVDELQKKDYVYKSSNVDGGTIYTWNAANNIVLLRFDSNTDGSTVVYTLDDQGNRSILWSGKTIIQRTKVTRISY